MTLGAEVHEQMFPSGGQSDARDSQCQVPTTVLRGLSAGQVSAPSTSETGNSHWVPNLGCIGVTPDFPPEPSQFLRFLSNMGLDIVIQEDNTSLKMSGRLRWMASRNLVKVAQ
ncbi:hypothetical protein TNCV_4732491 [Trichonephila clavipes]|nr:hypothetical protein TNCV_4732491 [Trichonephila clavipes]